MENIEFIRPSINLDQSVSRTRSTFSR